MDRVQRLQGSGGIYPEKCCRNSYGLVVRKLYDPKQHVGEDVSVDPRDGKKWAEKQVHWFIRQVCNLRASSNLLLSTVLQGEKISVEKGISEAYRLKINLGQETVPWKTHVVMCGLPSEQLPKSTKHSSVKSVCHIESVLNPDDMKLKNRHWYGYRLRFTETRLNPSRYNFKPRYNRADFNLKVMLGSADLKFQLWSKGERLSKDHEDIGVMWYTPTEKVHMAKIVVQDTSEMYRI